MRALLQRVSQAALLLNEKVVHKISRGLVVLVGFNEFDKKEDLEWTTRKIFNLRIFEDSHQKTNLSIGEIGGEVLVMSQFTLFASVKKGNRPSFVQAGNPEIAKQNYHFFLELLKDFKSLKIKSGNFASSGCKIQLTNDGPFTIWLDSKHRD